MITAERVRKIAGYGPQDLERLLNECGRKGYTFHSAQFLGITHAGEFCFAVVFYDINAHSPYRKKVFVRADSHGEYATEVI
jgi:hypothetical protein